MAPIYFKLKYGGLIRRVPFQKLPNWLDLSAKLNSLYNLPLKDIAVSFTDDDNDEITFNSNEELQDFYESFYQDGSTIILNVVNLSSSQGDPSSSLGESTVHVLAACTLAQFSRISRASFQTSSSGRASHS